MSAILTAIAAADEEFLVALSSKGLYKRAQRELPEAGVTVAAEGEAVTASFADGTELTMEGSIQGYRCTCPSRSVCKHLLMAVLAIQAAEPGGAGAETPAEGTAPAEVAPPPPDFSALADLEPKVLEKLAGKRLYRAAVLAVQLGETAEIKEGSTLAVTLRDSGETVRFLPGAPPESAGCSCKSAAFCAHRVQAVAQYIAFRKGGLPAAFLPEEAEEGEVEFGAVTLPYIKSFAAEVMATGLARLPEDAAGRFLQLATICHGGRMANLERLCRRIAGQLESFRRRSATFERDTLLGDLCSLLGLCEAMEAGDHSRATVGVFRDTYRPAAALTLHGLGAWGWHSTVGYTGVSALFYATEEQDVLTFTTALPDDTRPTVEKLYNSTAPWGLPTKLSAICHARLGLRGAKLSERGQLSSSESAQATPQGATEILGPALATLRYSDFSTLLEALWKRTETGADGPMAAIVVPARAGAGDYDKIAQRWTLPLYDGAERRLTLAVRYEPATRLLLENLMEQDEGGGLGRPLLVRVSLQGGKLVAFPVTLYGDEPMNLSLDKPKRPEKKKKSFFNWFT